MCRHWCFCHFFFLFSRRWCLAPLRAGLSAAIAVAVPLRRWTRPDCSRGQWPSGAIYCGVFRAWFSFVRLAPHRPHGLRCRAAVARFYIVFDEKISVIMGKSVGLLAPISGRVGNTVGYVLKDSKQTQGWRVYQPVVRNPQSDGQMVQRVKMAAVNNLYRDLKEIIQRGMENTEYGYAARKKWLSMALGQQFEGPWIIKGYTMGLPIKGVPISVGSLTPVVTNYVSQGNPPMLFLPCEAPEGDPITVAQLSALFIEAGYQEGDQVTFVYGWVTMREAFAWRWTSFVVSVSDTTAVGTLFGNSYINSANISEGSYGDMDGVYVDILPYSPVPIDALAVIISRDGVTLGSHLRSTAYFSITPTAAANWYSEGAYERAKRSYLIGDGTNTNWEQDPTRAATAPGETRANTNAATPVVITVDAWRNQDGFAQVHDATNNIWRYVYNEDVRATNYHKWLGGSLTGSDVWGATAPTGVQTTDAVRFVYSADANQYDVAFGNWLLDDVGYNPRYLLSMV